MGKIQKVCPKQINLKFNINIEKYNKFDLVVIYTQFYLCEKYV